MNWSPPNPDARRFNTWTDVRGLPRNPTVDCQCQPYWAVGDNDHICTCGLTPPPMCDCDTPAAESAMGARVAHALHCNTHTSPWPPPPMWDREDLQRVLYHVVDRYLAHPDDELCRSAIYDVAIPTLLDNGWWPEDRPVPPLRRNRVSS